MRSTHKNAMLAAAHQPGRIASNKESAVPVAPELALYVREAAAACGMSESLFATMALREHFRAMEAG